MSLLLLLRNHESGTTPPPPTGEDTGRGVGEELLWPATSPAVPARPQIPAVFPRRVKKPKKVLELTDEELLIFLGEL